MSELNQFQNKNMEVPLLKQEYNTEENMFKTGFAEGEFDQMNLQTEQWMQGEEQIPDKLLNEKISQAYAQVHNGAKIGRMERYKAKKEFKKKMQAVKSAKKVRQSMPAIEPDVFTGMEPLDIQQSIKTSIDEMRAVDLSRFDYSNDMDFLEKYQADQAFLIKGADLDTKVKQYISAGGFLDMHQIAELNTLTATFKELLVKRDARLAMLSNPNNLMLREKDMAMISDAKIDELSKSGNKTMENLSSFLLEKKKNITSEDIRDQQKAKVQEARVQRLSSVQKALRETEVANKKKFGWADLGLNYDLNLQQNATLHSAGIRDREPTKFSLVFMNYCAKKNKTFFDPMSDEDRLELKKTADEIKDTLQNNNTEETSATLLRNMFKGLISHFKAATGEGGSMESRFKSLIPRYDDSGEVLGQKLAHMATFKAFFKDFDQLLGGAGHTEAALKAMDGVTEEELKLYQTMASVFSLYSMAEEVPATTNTLYGANEDSIAKLINGDNPGSECSGSKYSWSAYIDYLTLAESETDKTCKSLDQFVKGEGDVHIPRPEIHSANYLSSVMMGPAMLDQMKQASNDLYKEQQENINNNELHLGKKFKLKIENGKASNVAPL